MPKSKRHKVVSLTKTTGKSKDDKTNTIEVLRSAVDEYKNLFAFTYENMRTAAFKDIRSHFKESRLYLGKNKVAHVALGKAEADEYRENLSMVSKQLTGDCGLFFTSRTKKEVLDYFKKFKFVDYAKAGFVAGENVQIKAGPLDTKFPTSMMEQLRKLGMVVEIDTGVIILRESYTAAAKGQALTPEQCKVLVHFERKLSPFKISLASHWTDGKFTAM